MSGWIGVDLDGTLAEYNGWQGIEHIGKPIPKMMARIDEWITVKIFTARVSVPEPEKTEVIKAIHKWCIENDLPELEVTNVKDFGMIELWDDRCVQVIPNTGEK